MDAKVDQYIYKHSNFSEEIQLLRKIILSTHLVETIKWGMPTYTINGKNVVSIGAFKTHFGLWFFKGALLKDIDQVFLNAQEGKTSAMLQWRFDKGMPIVKNKVESYIKEAIEIEKKGLKITPKKIPLLIPKELDSAFVENKILADNFNALPNGKKREFADYISDAKREETKHKRLEKIIPMILNKIGLNDKYKNC